MLYPNSGRLPLVNHFLADDRMLLYRPRLGRMSCCRRARSSVCYTPVLRLCALPVRNPDVRKCCCCKGEFSTVAVIRSYLLIRQSSADLKRRTSAVNLLSKLLV